jgi:hypothetical protein
MKFAKLFPPSKNSPHEETCTIGETFRLQDLQFASIPETDVPSASFIDGGNAVLFSTPTRAFGILKIAIITTEGLKRKDIQVHEYLVSVTRTDGTYAVRSEPLANADPRVSACLEGEFPADVELPEMLFDTLRALAEYAVAPEGITIHDGSLRTTNKLLQQRCQPRDQAFALAKTTAVLTSMQRPLGMALLTRAPQGCWYTQLTNGTYCVRLHDRAAHTFLLEGKQISLQVLHLLRAWSADMSFPGYPYPLILADQMARVTNNERDAWKMILKSDTQAAKILDDEMKAQDAHAMLEHILYGNQL